MPRAVAERAAAMEITKRSAQLLGYAVDTMPPGTALKEPLIFVHEGPISPSDRALVERRLLGHVARDSTTLVHVGADRFAICRATFERDFDTFKATFELPPRTKKNNLRWFGMQSAAYARYRNAIVDAVAESRAELQLPLPNQPFNLAATFYVDHWGERADLFGLLQGLADALQDASVVTDDWHFRSTDGCRIVKGDDRPRVELTITPIED